MVYWNPRIEDMPVSELKEMQLKQLKMLVYKLYTFSPFYRQKMMDKGVTPEDIRTLADVTKLPFMTKKDLRDGYPDKLFLASPREVVRYHASSGTTGKPTIVGYTQNDIQNWSESVARGLVSAGISTDDVLQVSYTYGLFSGGLGLHYAAEKVGAAVVPASTGNTERQIDLIRDMGVTAIAATPSYLLHLGEVAEKMGVSIKNDTKLRLGILGAEPWSQRMRERMEEWLGIRAIDIYGASELSGPLWCECSEQKGIHVWSDIALVEVIDPVTEEPVAPGEKGELVITMLQKEALPIIRYRLGDITTLHEEVCSCGRTHPRIGRIQGRVDDMIIIRGINVFPSQVEHCLMTNPEVGNEFQIVVDRKGALDTILVRAELRPEAFGDRVFELDAIKERVTHKLRGSLNVGVTVELVEPGSLPRSEGKAKRVVDKRVF
ncbi:MAG: phenylacetate--CoA ligase family protein [Methanomassiliicoccus sp.]|nr:MAG: phenylacetate--CoA ligase family protein [Methanomassiliicoccus sp.]